MVNETNTSRRLIPSNSSGQPPSPMDSPPDGPRPSTQSSSSNYKEENMVGEGGGNPPNPPNPPLPWLRRSAVAIPRVQHQFPKHIDKLLPKFNPDSKEPTKTHSQVYP